MMDKKLSEEHKRKIGLALKGRKKLPFSEEHIRHLRESHLGKKLSKEVCRKISLRMMGNKIGLGNKNRVGKHISDEQKEKIRFTHTGNTYRRGSHHTEETKRKMSIANLGRIGSEKQKAVMRARTGEKVWNWKGDKVSYRSLHKWVERQLGKPRCCEDCGDKSLSHRQYHWANISGLYKRVITDWRRLCVRCHKTYDKQQKLLKLNQEFDSSNNFNNSLG